MITGPKIITYGLVLYLDAANIKSYVSGSTVCYDLTKRNNNANLTLNDNDAFSYSENAFTFTPETNTGTTDYFIITGGDTTLYNELTIETVVNYSNYWGSAYYNRPVSGRVTEGNSSWGFGLGEGSLRVELNTNNGWLSGTFFSSNVGPNKPIYITQTTSISENTFKTYINGVLVATINLNGATPNSGAGALIGKGFYAGSRNFYGKIYFFKMYNRKLSSEEILQNYNATKSRFGL